MKKITILLFFLATCLIYGKAQPVFTNVPVLNGKVIFQQYVYIDQELSENQRYSLLYKWGKDKFTGNPLLSGIRFDDKARSLTVSSKVELLLPENSAGVREKMMMNYRFDASITNVGCMLVIRDITYQTEPARGSSSFPKAYTAEEMITESSAASGSAADRELKSNTRTSTLAFFNQLYDDLNKIFILKK